MFQLTEDQKSNITFDTNFNFNDATIIEQTEEYIFYDAPHISLLVYDPKLINHSKAVEYANAISNNFNMIIWNLI